MTPPDGKPPKKKIVRKKSAVGGQDDQQLLRAQRAKAAEMKKRQVEAAKRKQAEEAEAQRQAELEAKRQAEQANNAELAAQMAALEAEKAKFEAEKAKLEAERELAAQKAALEAEKARLELERMKLQTQTGATKAGLPPAPVEEEEEAPLSPEELAEMLGGDDMPPAAPVSSRKSKSMSMDEELPPAAPARPKTGTKKKKAASKRKPKAKAATPAPAPRKATPAPAPAAEADSPAFNMTDSEEAPTLKGEAQDWLNDISTGVNWNKSSIYIGGAALFALLFLYFWPAVHYGIWGLPEGQVFVTLPQDSALPGPKPTIDETQTFLAMGPLMMVVPTKGPHEIIWHEAQHPIEYQQKVTLKFEGFSITIGRYKPKAILEFLGRSPQASKISGLISDYNAVDKPDYQLVDDVMNLTTSNFSMLSGPGTVSRFRARMNLKEQLFPEIANGVGKVTYGSTAGFVFGEPGRDKPVRIEVFETASGVRYSYTVTPGEVETALGKLKFAQNSSKSDQAETKSDFAVALKKYETDSRSHVKALKMGMYAAGLAMEGIGVGLQNSQVQAVRSALNQSPYAGLYAKDDDAAMAALDALRGKEFIEDLVIILHGMMADVSKKRRTRALKMAAKVTGDQTLIGVGEIPARAALMQWWKRYKAKHFDDQDKDKDKDKDKEPK